jgi:hypothetical protein
MQAGRLRSSQRGSYSRYMFDNPVSATIADFLLKIGLNVESGPTGTDTFLPGISIRAGVMIVDESKLKYPGDLLHEAGHLAVAPGKIRESLSDEVDLPGFNMDAIEVGAMAWSYAAALHLGLDPAVVFHKDGYRGKAERLLENFSMGIYFGVNVLEEALMATTGDSKATPYPHMLKWLRE